MSGEYLDDDDASEQAWDQFSALAVEGVVARAEAETLRKERDAALAEVERLKREQIEERQMLVFLASAYMAAKREFGMPGQPTWLRFPSIQGSAVIRAVERIAAIGTSEGQVAPTAVADRVVAAATHTTSGDESFATSRNDPSS